MAKCLTKKEINERMEWLESEVTRLFDENNELKVMYRGLLSEYTDLYDVYKYYQKLLDKNCIVYCKRELTITN